MDFKKTDFENLTIEEAQNKMFEAMETVQAESNKMRDLQSNALRYFTDYYTGLLEDEERKTADLKKEVSKFVSAYNAKLGILRENYLVINASLLAIQLNKDMEKSNDKKDG